MADGEDDLMNKHYRFKAVPAGTVRPEVTYKLLSESPHKIENWMKRFKIEEPGETKVLSVASMNDVFAEKAISYRWSPDLKLLVIKKCEGRNRVSFEHVKKPRTNLAMFSLEKWCASPTTPQPNNNNLF
jgi:hypothetical protein